MFYTIFSDQPSTIEMPAENSSQEAKMHWLIELCRKHVEKYVGRSQLVGIVQQTQELNQANQEGFACRFQGCDKTYVFHSRRVR